TPQNVASCTGIKAEEIEQLVEEFCKAERAVFYSRIGVSTHEFGSITLWLTNLFNLLTGNLDSEGGLMLPTPAVDLIGARKPKSKKFKRYHSRVSQYPETIGEFPVAALAEEILTPGDGQIKAMVTACGNPCLSNPNNELMKKAFGQLEFMFSIDLYINETTKYANIILPPPSPLERPHYDLAFTQLAVRNYAKYSETLFKRPKGSLSEAEIYQNLTWRFSEKGLKNKVQLWLKQKTMKTLGPKGIIDKGVKRGPYGKDDNNFFQNLNMSKLEQHHNGMDLGSLQSCFPKRILTENGKINLAPTELVDDLKRLGDSFNRLNKKEEKEFPYLLIGRRDPRTCNSWMHNSYRLVKGKPACIAHINHADATKLNVKSGEQITITSRVGSIKIPVEVTENMMEGVVSVPHGWGHGEENTQMSIANTHAGSSVNQLTDEKFVDQLTGNAALNGVPIQVVAV
ncbi:MAG: molybdopterin-dependent oxidoreductase, partial [Kangiellaceae bacterium]|nr:molybdopterin-dependent oxidoreductase [Kangiellaceae bacterium]